MPKPLSKEARAKEQKKVNEACDLMQKVIDRFIGHYGEAVTHRAAYYGYEHAGDRRTEKELKEREELLAGFKSIFDK